MTFLMLAGFHRRLEDAVGVGATATWTCVTRAAIETVPALRTRRDGPMRRGMGSK